MLVPHVTVDLTGFRELAGQTQALLVNLCQVAADAGSEAGAAEAKGKPQSWFKDRTGATRRSIVATPSTWIGRTAWGDYRATTPWALFLEEGTKPHPIDARRVPNLIFWWALKSVLFIGPHVNHPGSYARRFMGDRMTTWWKAEQAALKAAEQGVARIVNVWH
jgi:hypothetical protein